MDIFSTDAFLRSVRSRHIGHGRCPRRRKDPLVFDRQVHLQELAPVIAEDIASEQPILFFVPLDGVLHVVVIAQPQLFFTAATLLACNRWQTPDLGVLLFVIFQTWVHQVEPALLARADEVIE
jgi:hypothetical protein